MNATNTSWTTLTIGELCVKLPNIKHAAWNIVLTGAGNQGTAYPNVAMASV